MKYRFGLKYFSEDDKTTLWKKHKKAIQNYEAGIPFSHILLKRDKGRILNMLHKIDIKCVE